MTDVPDWLATAIEAWVEGDLDGWMAIYAEDAVHEFPFAPPGAPRGVEGQAAIAELLRPLQQHIRFGRFELGRVRQIGDETIVEATGHHRVVATDTALDLDYVWFITRHDGKVTHFRDYMNPLQLSGS